RIPDGSPTRDFVPPWFASTMQATGGLSAPSRGQAGTSEITPLRRDNAGEYLADYLQAFLGDAVYCTTANAIVNCQAGSHDESRGLGAADLTYYSASRSHNISEIRAMMATMWDTRYPEFEITARDQLPLVAGDEII
ncbi:hypothetical protein V1525DRAFT_325856, partial [Lipomyces kononenkoae]